MDLKRHIFIFRLAPGFFVDLGSFRRFITAEEYEEEGVVIRRITEQEYMFLRRMGTYEASMMMEQYDF
ncbi:MAG TPA: hypothetical protein GXX35_15095 [Thermoanaerobacterales bacterium]|nr:hypothetical protein [Thermoanaerobacterales bacterium]